MRIGYFGGTVNDGTIDDVVAEVRQAEADGFDTYWAPQIFGHDALTALAVAGREVPRIELGTSVVPTFPRHPMMLAQQALTVNAACDGRLTLGIGLSHQVVIETLMGMSFDKPVRHLRDYLSILGPLSRQEPVNYHGEMYSSMGAVTVKGATPFGIVVAALGPQMLKVAAELADGTLTWCTGPNTLADHTIPTINAAAEAAGRPAPRVIAALPVCVTSDTEGAAEPSGQGVRDLRHAAELPGHARPGRCGGSADIAITGTGGRGRRTHRRLADIGVTDFAAVEFPGNPDEAAATRAAVKLAMG